MDDLRDARSALEVAARDFDPSACTGDDAIHVVETIGAIRRLADGVLGKAAKRVEDTAAYTYKNERNAAELCERLTGVSRSEAKRAIDVAGKLGSLPATDAAIRAGTLSSRQADLIVSVAADDPSVERQLLKTASKGMVPLRDKCIAVRAEREDQTERSERQQGTRSFMMWPTADGMMEGHFKVIPEIGGAIATVIEHGTRKKFREARKAKVQESQDAYAADAFAEAILGDPATKKTAAYTTHVIVDHEALLRGNTVPGETCEPGVGPVNVEWVRELLGEAFVTAIIKKGKDITTVTHLGRHIPAELQTALIVSGRECCIEGCSGREYLERDHSEIDHAKNGPTAWWNIEWECSIHHYRKTQGWILGPPDPVTGKRTLTPPADWRAA